MNNLVIHHKNGEIEKGYSNNFAQIKPNFHLKCLETEQVKIISLDTLKAVFFVKSFIGDSSKTDSHDFTKAPAARNHLIVHFNDGEKFYGVSDAIHRDRIGFWLNPCDRESNVIRTFVINSFIETIEFVD